MHRSMRLIRSMAKIILKSKALAKLKEIFSMFKESIFQKKRSATGRDLEIGFIKDFLNQAHLSKNTKDTNIWLGPSSAYSSTKSI